MHPSPFLPLDLLHLDWIKITEGVLSGGAIATFTWLFGRRQQKWREKIDTRTADQRNIDQLMGRVGNLETQMTTANQKIEDLRSEKMKLQAEIISLQQQIALLEVQKATFESREAFFTAHVAELELRLTVKSEELRCAEQRLAEMEDEQRKARRLAEEERRTLITELAKDAEPTHVQSE